MGRSRVIVRDFGLKRILKNARDLGKANVTVGVHGTAKPHKNDEGESTPLAFIAAVNEFGSSDGHVPERSFIRSTVDEQLGTLRRIRDQALRKVVLDDLAPRKALALIGAYLQGKIQEKIASNIPPPNAPSTVSEKGSSGTLIDTGQLRQSITYQVHPNGFVANAKVEE